MVELDINITSVDWASFSAWLLFNAYLLFTYNVSRYLGELFLYLAKRLFLYYSYIVILVAIYGNIILGFYGFTVTYCEYVEIPAVMGAILAIWLVIRRAKRKDLGLPPKNWTDF